MMLKSFYKNQKKIQEINDDYIIDILKKFDIELGYKKVNHKHYIPSVYDIKNDMRYFENNYIKSDKRDILYEGAAFANYLLCEHGVITEEQKNNYDKLFNKLYNCQTCLS